MTDLSSSWAAGLRYLDDLDWSTWRPSDLATLCFIVEAERILLIHKKRGLGAGKLNGPGGRLENGESPLAGAIREVEEELRITPSRLTEAGELRFQFLDGYGLHVYVFRADAYEGTPVETVEAIPCWHSLDAIPFDLMWEDDRHWLPLLLVRRHFDGRFLFDGDRMLDYDLSRGPARGPARE